MWVTVASLAGTFGILAGTVTGVAVNPLPAPRSVTWGTSGPFGFSPNIQLNGASQQLVSDAWNRAHQAIVKLQWVPAATEAPP